MMNDKDRRNQSCQVRNANCEPSDNGPQHRIPTRKRKGQEKVLNIGTWNVRTLLKDGKLEELKDVLQTYDMDITALQELRLKGKDIERDKQQQFDPYPYKRQ